MIDTTLSRRDLLRIATVAGGGLMIGIRLEGQDPADAAPFEPSAWLRLDPDGTILVRVPKQEMGQGVRTSLAAIVADELDVEFDRVTVESAEPSPATGPLGTGGSGSLSRSWDLLRRAGATARVLLVAAAAEQWRVKVDTCHTDRGAVRDLKGRIVDYRFLLGDAARQSVPENPPLKSRREYRLIGRAQPRVDGPAIVDGSAVYGVDVRLPGMLYAVVARSPTLGGALANFDNTGTLAVPGVRSCFAIPSGVAVVADSTWAALRGRAALVVAWEPGPHAAFSSAAHGERLVAAVEAPAIVTRREGSGRDALAGAARRFDATYLYPFSAHGAIEPVNTTARVGGGSCEIWSPTQAPTGVQRSAAATLGIPASAVTVHLPLMGGGFGRRLGWDYAVEAVEIARRIEAPVQLLWTREDDLVHGHFQAASAERLFAGLDPAGRLVAWEHRRASTPHTARGRPTAAELADPAYLADISWGAADSPYYAPNLQTSYAVVEAPVPIGPWRAVFSPPAVFARECFVDELAQARGIDPLDLRLELLGAGDPAIAPRLELAGNQIDRPRLRQVLEAAAARIDWRTAPAAGRMRGIACDVFHTQTCVAWAVEVSLRPGDPGFGIDRIVGAIDCGFVVDPGIVAQQMESGVAWSLATLLGGTTFAGGRAVESNFDQFRIPTLTDIAPIEVEILRSADESPHGVGEPPVAPFAPAVVNALSRALGRRLRRLPLRSAEFA